MSVKIPMSAIWIMVLLWQQWFWQQRSADTGFRTERKCLERTEWHNIIFWRGLAETVEKYVHKGDKLFVEGKIRSRSYDDQNGVKRYITEIFADNMEMLTPRSSTQAAPAQNSNNKDMSASRPSVTTQEGTVDDLPF